MSAPFLELRGITRRFGAVQALAGVDLEVGPRELVVVLGPTGAGKTTLLRTIAGLTDPDGGTVRMDGADVTHLAPPERDVALVFQNFSLYPRWTVRRNLEFPLRAPGRGMSATEIRERVSQAADLLHIEALLERDSRRLSGGEMQRVAIGRAIVRRPRLFLMDEPLTNLDAKLRESLRVEIVRLARELETPLVYVTHDQAEALSMGDRIVVLSEGRVLQSGTPREVYRRPATPEVARQLGQPAINVLSVRSDGEHWVTEDGTPVTGTTAGDGQTARIGVRPEHVALIGRAAHATVELVEDAGPHRVVTLAWAGTTLHALAPADAAVAPGDRVNPSIENGSAVVWTS